MLLIQTAANCERAAERALTAPYRGCRVYFPRILTRRSHARRVDYAERPFIQRYGFVENDHPETWRAVRSCPGVACVVASGDEVARAADEIRAREYDAVGPDGGPARYVRLDDEERVPGETREFRDGDLVTVPTVLAELGLFKRMASATRAVVLMTLFGTKREVTVPVALVRAA